MVIFLLQPVDFVFNHALKWNIIEGRRRTWAPRNSHGEGKKIRSDVVRNDLC